MKQYCDLLHFLLIMLGTCTYTLPGSYSDIHSFNYYGAACFSGVSNESLSTKVPIYKLSVCSYLEYSTSLHSVSFPLSRQ